MMLPIDQLFGGSIIRNGDFEPFLTSIRETYVQVRERYYMTNTFRNAVDLAYPKIVEKDKHINEIPSDCGIIFSENGFSLYLANPADKKVKFLCFGFTKKALTTYGFIDNDGNFGGVAAMVKDGKPYNDLQYLNNYMQGLLTTIYFIHNCEIEEKLVKADRKVVHNNDKFLNETKSDIKILDCKWFTDLVRDTPFHVKGHLRWQRHGEKFSKRKLIWIDEFEKSGYTRKATKTTAHG